MVYVFVCYAVCFFRKMFQFSVMFLYGVCICMLCCVYFFRKNIRIFCNIFVWCMYLYAMLCVFVIRFHLCVMFFLFDSSGHIRGSLHVRDSAAITPRFPLLPGPLVRRGQPGHRHRRHLRRQAASREFPPSRQPATVSLLGRSPERLECRLRGLPRRHDRHPRLHYGGALARSPGPVRLLRALFEAPRHHPLCAVGFDGRGRAAGHGVPCDWGRGGVSRIGVRAARHGLWSWGGPPPWLKKDENSKHILPEVDEAKTSWPTLQSEEWKSQFVGRNSVIWWPSWAPWTCHYRQGHLQGKCTGCRDARPKTKTGYNSNNIIDWLIDWFNANHSTFFTAIHFVFWDMKGFSTVG